MVSKWQRNAKSKQLTYKSKPNACLPLPITDSIIKLPKTQSDQNKQQCTPIPSQYSTNTSVSLTNIDPNTSSDIANDDYDTNVMTHLDYLINMTQ